MSTRKKPVDQPEQRESSGSGSGTRPARRAGRPEGPALALDPELDGRMYALVMRVADEGEITLPPDPQWILAADAAKRAGYLVEKGFRLSITKHGEQWLESRAKPAGKEFTYTKIREHSRLQLKDLARDTGVPMQDTIGELIGAFHAHRDELTRIARKHGAEHPWEALRFLVK